MHRMTPVCDGNITSSSRIEATSHHFETSSFPAPQHIRAKHNSAQQAPLFPRVAPTGLTVTTHPPLCALVEQVPKRCNVVRCTDQVTTDLLLVLEALRLDPGLARPLVGPHCAHVGVAGQRVAHQFAADRVLSRIEPRDVLGRPLALARPCAGVDATVLVLSIAEAHCRPGPGELSPVRALLDPRRPDGEHVSGLARVVLCHGTRFHASVCDAVVRPGIRDGSMRIGNCCGAGDRAGLLRRGCGRTSSSRKDLSD